MQLVLPGQSGADASFVMADTAGSFWRGVARKHAPFALEPVRVEFSSDPAFGATVAAVVPRQGDLLAGAMLELRVTSLPSAYPKAVGAWYPAEALVKEVSLWIGGTLVDRHTSDFFRVYDALHRDAAQSDAYARMTNFDPAVVTSDAPAAQTLYLPLLFSFCRHPSLALPLVAMERTEIRVAVTFASAADAGVDESAGLDARLFCDFCYLGNAERVALVREPSLDFLVEQVQTHVSTLADGSPSPTAVTAHAARLRFFRPVKALYWFLADPLAAGTAQRTHHARWVGDFQGTYQSYQPAPGRPSGLAPVDVLGEGLAPVASATIAINGTPRLAERDGSYFNKVVPFLHCRRCPPPGLYMFSFALNPGSHAPTGECTFSTLDNAELQLRIKRDVSGDPADLTTEAKNIGTLKELRVLAWGFNVLRVVEGKGALAF